MGYTITRETTNGTETWDYDFAKTGEAPTAKARELAAAHFRRTTSSRVVVTVRLNGHEIAAARFVDNGRTLSLVTTS